MTRSATEKGNSCPGSLFPAWKRHCRKTTRLLVLGVLLPLCLCSTPLRSDSPGRAPVDLSGTWAGLFVYTGLATFPVIGTVTSAASVLLRIEIAQTASSLTLKETYCSIEINAGTPLARMVFPEAFVPSLGTVMRQASIEETGASTRFVQSWRCEVRGAHLVDPERDELPATSGDPRVFDQDADGEPGLTARVCVADVLCGDVYLVERMCQRLLGTVISRDRIEGTIDWVNERSTLGSTNPLLGSAIQTPAVPLAEESYFVLRRIDPHWDCEAVTANRDMLFGP